MNGFKASKTTKTVEKANEVLHRIDKPVIVYRSDPAGTVTLPQRCHNVAVDVVTTLWHGRK